MKFELITNIENINDSMELDSGTVICTAKEGNKEITIEVSGEVQVEYKGDIYKYPSEFPKELLDIFHNHTEYENDNVYITFNNWFEVFCSSGVCECVDLENYSENDLITLCREIFNDTDFW